MNGFKSGRGCRNRLAVGKLPKGCSWINSLIGAFRRELERSVLDAHGVLDYKAALIIQSAARHEQAALLAQRWLRLSSENMSHGERLSYLQAIAAESDKRDRCIERLKLDIDPQTIIGALYGPVTPLDAKDTQGQPECNAKL
jgi:hypothetical protein